MTFNQLKRFLNKETFDKLHSKKYKLMLMEKKNSFRSQQQKENDKFLPRLIFQFLLVCYTDLQIVNELCQFKQICGKFPRCFSCKPHLDLL